MITILDLGNSGGEFLYSQVVDSSVNREGEIKGLVIHSGCFVFLGGSRGENVMWLSQTQGQEIKLKSKGQSLNTVSRKPVVH